MSYVLILFIISQGAAIAIAFFYPLATAAWFIALVPLGWRYLTDKAANVVLASR